MCDVMGSDALVFLREVCCSRRWMMCWSALCRLTERVSERDERFRLVRSYMRHILFIAACHKPALSKERHGKPILAFAKILAFDSSSPIPSIDCKCAVHGF